MKRKRIVGKFSSGLVKRYLADRAYEAHGLTEQQYIVKCEKAWKKIKYDPIYERKIIVDFSQPITPARLFGLDATDVDFVDPAMADASMRGFEGKTGIECLVMFAAPAPHKGGKPTPVRADHMFRPAKDVTGPETLNEQLYLVGLFDVLGFSALVAEKGTTAVLGTYQQLIDKAVQRSNYAAFGRVRLGENKYALGGFNAPVRYTYFSDTIMLWVPWALTHASPFLAKCADLICEALEIGMPLRGSICCGPAVMNKSANTFIGPALVEAADIEKNQTWIGATLGVGFMLNVVKEALSESLVVPLYCEHFKPGMKLSVPYLTLDWVKRWNAAPRPAVTAVLDGLKQRAPSASSVYYDRTIDFVRYVDLDPLEARAVFLRATTFRVKNLAKANLHMLGPEHPVVLKVTRETPHSGYLINPAKGALEADGALRAFCEENILFVKRLDYPAFVANLPSEPGASFDLAASGVVMRVERRHVEYIDVFNYDPKERPKESTMNFELIC